MQDILTFYKGVFNRYFGFNPIVVYGRDGATIKRLLEVLSPIQLKLFIVIHFNWRGMDNNDQQVFKRLRDNAFPLTWILTNLNAYQAYIVNVLGIDLYNEVEVEEYYTDFLK